MEIPEKTESSAADAVESKSKTSIKHNDLTEDSSSASSPSVETENSSMKLENHPTLPTSEDGLKVADNLNNAGYVCEKIDGVYLYKNPTTNEQYRYDESKQDWTLVPNEESSDGMSECNKSDACPENDVHVDEEGRTYYYADGHYLCRYPTGHVYYMSENQEWVLWSDDPNSTNSNENPSGENNNENKWYYYKGEDAFYRDNLTNSIFKLNKETNEWCLLKSKKKRKKGNTTKSTAGGEEEFDTESSDDEECGSETGENEEAVSGEVPPGYNKDPSISFEDGCFIKRDKDGMMYDWDKHRRAWFPKLDETFMAKYQMSYGFNPDGTKNENPVKYDDDEEEEDLEALAKEKERKKKEEEKKKKEKKPAGWFEADDAHNTKVYVSQLPEDITEQQFVDLMQKCGLVLKDPETGQYKVKLYKDKDGNFKGDALCTYIKVESVSLALQILDGSCVSASSTQRIRVERAKFQMRGEYNATLKPKKKKKKLIEKLQKKQEKLFAWTPEPLRGQRGKNESVVVIRNAFSPQEFVEHAERILGHTDSLRAQCASFGAVKKLELYDRHPEGVVKVAFSEVEAADLCIASMHNRLYNGRKLSVAVWDGAENFRVEETEEEKAERLKKWDEFLMKGDDEKSDKSSNKATQEDEKNTQS